MSIATTMWPTDKLDKSRLIIHMAYRQTLRNQVEIDCPSLYKQYIMYTSTRSNFCPMVYQTCQQIIDKIRTDGKEPFYLKLLSDIEDSIGTDKPVP